MRVLNRNSTKESFAIGSCYIAYMNLDATKMRLLPKLPVRFRDFLAIR